MNKNKKVALMLSMVIALRNISAINVIDLNVRKIIDTLKVMNMVV